MPNLQRERDLIVSTESSQRGSTCSPLGQAAVAARVSCGYNMTTANKVKAPQNSINEILPGYARREGAGQAKEEEKEEGLTHFHFHFQRWLYDTVRHRAGIAEGRGREKGLWHIL